MISKESVEIIGVHLVAPETYKGLKEVIESISEDADGKEITVTLNGWEYNYDSLRYWVESEDVEEPDILLMFDTARYSQNFDRSGSQYQTLLDSLRKTRLKLTKSKIVIVLSKEREKDTLYLNELIKLGIYNFNFVESTFTAEHIKNWIFGPEKTMKDVDKYIAYLEGGSQYKPQAHRDARLEIETHVKDQENGGAKERKASSNRSVKLPSLPSMGMPSLKFSITAGRKTKLLGSIEIGVGAVSQSSAGCTHTALAIARYLAKQKRKVALIEYNDSPSLYFLKPEADEIMSRGFKYKGIDIYPQETATPDATKPYCGAARSQYEYIVFDLGNMKRLDSQNIIYPTKSYDKMWSTNFQVACLNGSAWGYRDLEYYRNDEVAQVEPELHQWNVVANLSTSQKTFKAIQERVREITAIEKLTKAPFYSDPLNLGEEAVNYLAKLLRPILLDETQHEEGGELGIIRA